MRCRNAVLVSPLRAANLPDMIARSRLFAALFAGLAAALFLVAPANAQKPPAGNADADDVVLVETADQKMNAAIARAQERLPEYLALLAEPPRGVGDFSFKFPLEGVEHIWVADVVRDGDFLIGRLNNNPYSPGWARGDPVRVPLSEVSDWGYWDDKGNSYGYFTVRVMLDYMSPAEAEAVSEYYGWDD